MNAVLAIVHIRPGDKIVKDKDATKPVTAPPSTSASISVKTEVKEEPTPGSNVSGEEVKPESAEGVKEEKQNGDEGGEGVKEEEDDMDDEVPYIEDIGTREIAGFIVM